MNPFNHKSLSLAARVMLFVGASIGLSLFIIGNLVLDAVEHHFAEQDAGELAEVNKAVVNVLRAHYNNPSQLRKALSSAVSGHHGVYYQVHDQQGSMVFESAGSNLSVLKNSLHQVSEINASDLRVWHEDNKNFRGVLTHNSIAGQNYLVLTAIDIDFHLQFLHEFRLDLWSMMILAWLMTLLAAWYGVHKAHEPIRRLSNKMGDIQADRLDMRIAPSVVPSELKDLVSSFNHMISRLEESFNQLSHFSADIAHELRTPLTNLIIQTQVGLGKSRTLEEYRELLYSNLEEQERLAKMINDMLWLAKRDHGLIKLEQTPLDLSDEVSKLFGFFEALAEDKNIVLSLEGQVQQIQGDKAMLRRAISNLLSNAIRYTKSGGSVLVRLKNFSDNEVSLTVENPGPEIPVEHLPYLFDRFYRANPSRSRQGEGAGLGLAIARSIIDAHGGRVEVTSKSDKTAFIIYLPTTIKAIQ